jgi:hypothetical protein
MLTLIVDRNALNRLTYDQQTDWMNAVIDAQYKATSECEPGTPANKNVVGFTRELLVSTDGIEFNLSP